MAANTMNGSQRGHQPFRREVMKKVIRNDKIPLSLGGHQAASIGLQDLDGGIAMTLPPRECDDPGVVIQAGQPRLQT